MSDAEKLYVNVQDTPVMRIKPSDYRDARAAHDNPGLRRRIREKSSVVDPDIEDINMASVPVHDPNTDEIIGFVKSAGNGRVVIDVPTSNNNGNHRLKERMEINSAEGKEREVTEEEKRQERRTKQERAENHSNDALIESRENLADFKRTHVQVQYFVLPISVGAACSPIVYFDTYWMIVPMVLGILGTLVSAGILINWFFDRTQYNLEASVRKAESSHRDVVNRPISWYDGKSLDEL